MNAPRAFAVVPAAGRSRRMGEPKLLLRWNGGTIIEATLAAWKRSDVAAVIVVVRSDDVQLAALCRRSGADVVVAAADPPHMRDSVQLALQHVAAAYQPADGDAWLLAPADMPRLSPAIANRLIASHQPQAAAILTPTLAGRRGHPVLFPWPLARLVSQIPADRGIDALRWHHPTREVPCDDLPAESSAFADVDTPEAYARSRGRQEK